MLLFSVKTVETQQTTDAEWRAHFRCAVPGAYKDRAGIASGPSAEQGRARFSGHKSDLRKKPYVKVNGLTDRPRHESGDEPKHAGP